MTEVVMNDSPVPWSRVSCCIARHTAGIVYGSTYWCRIIDFKIKKSRDYYTRMEGGKEVGHACWAHHHTIYISPEPQGPRAS